MPRKNSLILGFVLIFVFSWVEQSWPLVYLFLLLASQFGGLKYGLICAAAAIFGALNSVFWLDFAAKINLLGYIFLTLISLSLGVLFRQEENNAQRPDSSPSPEPTIPAAFLNNEEETLWEKEDISFEIKQKRIQLRVSLDISQKLDKLLDFLNNYLTPQSLIFFLLDTEANCLKVNKFRSSVTNFEREVLISPGQGLVGWVAKSQKPLHIKDASQHNVSLLYYQHPQTVRSFLAVPIFSGAHFVGVLAADSPEINHFREDDEKLLSWCGKEIVQIMQGAEEKRLFLRRVAETSLLYDASQELNASLNENDILTSLAHTASKIVGQEKTAFLGLDEKKTTLKVETVVGYPDTLLNHQEAVTTSNLLSWIIHHHQPLRINNIQDRLNPELDQNPLYHKMHSCLGLPLFVGEHLRGILVMVSRTRNRFSQTEQETLTILTNLAAFALNKAELYAQMKKMAVTDGLTNLFNHQYFEKKLIHEIARARRYQKNLSLIFLDIDHFKNINDSYGHPVGDEVLRIIGSVLQEELRDIDVPSRYGGEEFALILPETDIDNAFRVAERLRNKVSERLSRYAPIKEKVTISLGVGTFPYHGEGEEDLLTNVDQALYAAKNNGRDQTVRCHKIKDAEYAAE